jgi:ribonuclease Z
MTFEITILGSSSAIPTAVRNPTAQLLNAEERFMLIDCGEGTQIQLRKYRFSMSRIHHIFISHLHGDHYFGLIGLLSTLSLLGNKNDMQVYAPPELETLLQGQLASIRGGLGFTVFFHPLTFSEPQIILDDEKMVVTSFPLRHSIPTCGFLFREKEKLPNMNKEMIRKYRIPFKAIREIKEGAGFTTENGQVISHEALTLPPRPPRTYAFCSDTAYHEPVIDMVRNVDLLYHESTFQNDKKKLAGETLHSTAEQAATIARKAGVSKLLIGHFSNRYRKSNGFLKEARAVFPETDLAEEGKTFRINPKLPGSPPQKTGS